MLKILFIGMTPNPGGLETYMINIFSAMQNHGFQFYFVNTFSHNIAYSHFIRNNGGKIYHMPLKAGMLKYLTRYHDAKLFFNKHHNFDIIHINALSLNELYWAKAAKSVGIKNIIFQSHNSGIVYKSKIISIFGKLMSLYNHYYLKFHHYIFALAASNSCGKWMFGKNVHFNVVNNGIDTNYFYPNSHYRYFYRKILGIKPYQKVLITTARISKQKNYPKIIKVFNEIYKLNKNMILIIIGAGNKYHVIKDMVNKLNLNSVVYFLGTKTKRDISKLLNIGDLMIMPSYFEAVPFSLTEAQAEGLPAIVSKGIPKEANITGHVTYMSISESNLKWAKRSINILKNNNNINNRIKMNKLVNKSNYNVYNSLLRIKRIYIRLI